MPHISSLGRVRPLLRLLLPSPLSYFVSKHPGIQRVSDGVGSTTPPRKNQHPPPHQPPLHNAIMPSAECSAVSMRVASGSDAHSLNMHLRSRSHTWSASSKFHCPPPGLAHQVRQGAAPPPRRPAASSGRGPSPCSVTLFEMLSRPRAALGATTAHGAPSPRARTVFPKDNPTPSAVLQA